MNASTLNHKAPCHVAVSRQSAANRDRTRWQRSADTPLRPTTPPRRAMPSARLLLVSAALCLLMAGTALAQSSATSISFQGALNGADGQRLPNGAYDLAFRFWDGPAPGGVASTAIPVQPEWFDGQTRYLGITIQEVNGGQELLPRVLVTAVPYAHASFATGRLELGPAGTNSLVFNANGDVWHFRERQLGAFNFLATSNSNPSAAHSILVGAPDPIATGSAYATFGVGGLTNADCVIQAVAAMNQRPGDIFLNPNGGNVTSAPWPRISPPSAWATTISTLPPWMPTASRSPPSRG